MKNLKIWIHQRLPRLNDRLPICGRFYRDRLWTGCGPLPYPLWFIALCRLEGWVILRLYRWTYK